MKKIFLIALALAALMVAACSSNDNGVTISRGWLGQNCAAHTCHCS